MKIDNSTGIWLNSSLEGHGYDMRLSDAIIQVLKRNKVKTIYDLGCGHGMYTKHINDNDIQCSGYDGNPFTRELTGNLCDVLDLSKTFILPKKEYVLSLEVGEHIPKEYEENFINNLHQHNERGIILSWAVVGQGGDGHINCQNNEYIREKFFDLGYKSDLLEEMYLREKSQFDWFKKTIMVFKR
jgi:cyclopropane fatty-acyl-phospholipid synthase-like methyltransferase